MTQLIGNKSRIAVEYSIENQNKFIGFAKLWLNDSFLGSSSDTIFIDGYLIGGFNAVLSKNKLSGRYLSDKKDEIYELLNNDILFGEDALYELAKSYRVNFGTWSDYFDVYSYKLTDSTGAFLWRLIERNDGLKDLIDYPSNVFYETFDYDELLKIIEHLNTVKKLQH